MNAEVLVPRAEVYPDQIQCVRSIDSHGTKIVAAVQHSPSLDEPGSQPESLYGFPMDSGDIKAL